MPETSEGSKARYAIGGRSKKVASDGQSNGMDHGISIIVAYYNNHEMLAKQLEWITRWSPELLKSLEFVIIDDGSVEKPAKPEIFLNMPLRLVLYRISSDIPWNQDAARNIGAAKAAYDRLLFIDIDHLLTEELIGLLLKDGLAPDVVYRFPRKSAVDGSVLDPHVNSFMCHRDTFWKAGGYDETFRGFYGSDYYFLQDLGRAASFHIFEGGYLLRVPKRSIADANTTTLSRAQPRWVVISRKILDISRRIGWRKKKIMRCNYEEVIRIGVR
jgi:hypothetical protein